MDQRDIHMISDWAFRVLTFLWLIASEDKEMDGNLPPIEDIAFRMRCSNDKINKALQELAPFLIIDDISPISERYQADEPEESRGETETEVETQLLSDVFENLWGNYPNKQGRKEALRHFNASVKTKKDLKDVGDALINYLNHLKVNTWKRPKNGSTWFNNWQDWIEWVEPDAPKEIKQEKSDPQMEMIRNLNGGSNGKRMAGRSDDGRIIDVTSGSSTVLPIE